MPKYTAVSSEAWAKLREWAIWAGKGRLLISGSVVLATLKAAVRGLRSTVTGTGTRNRGVAMMIAVVAVGLDGGGERGGK